MLLIFGHYVDFFNYTFVEPNWNKELQHGHHAKVQTDKVILYAQHDEHPAATSDATPAHENKEEVTVEVKHDGAVEAHGEHGTVAEAHGAHGAAEGHGAEAPVTNFAAIGIGELLIFIGFLGAFLLHSSATWLNVQLFLRMILT